MPNLIDYIKANRNKTFEEMPLTKVDNLILSTLSYLDFTSANYSIGMTLHDYYTDVDAKKILNDLYISKESALKIIKYLAYSKRYYNIKIFNYQENFSEKEIYQFSATTFHLPDDKLFVAFRGTDEKLESWHENFALSYNCPVISQYIASKYLEKILLSFDKDIYVGGHSKGGNLAVYSALMQKPSKQDRILKIFANDAPGFPKFILESKRYSIIKDKIISIVPHSSLVGMLLSHENNYKVVESSDFLIMQHNPLNWQTDENGFIYTELSKESIVMDKSINNWVKSIDPKKRKEFVDVLFSYFYALRDETSIENGVNPLDVLINAVKTANDLDKKDRQMMQDIITRLIKEIISNIGK